MSPDTTISLALIVSLVSIGLAIASAYRNRRNDEESARKREADRITAENSRQLDIEKNFVAVNYKLDNFTASIEKMSKDSNERVSELKKVAEQMIVVNEQMKTLFNYHKDHEMRIQNLEQDRDK